ncbi:hypothetical protein CMO96_02920 [Candidatus Woesebacteria bacterium]|nr:hypothetical protein [Candidatus Woesebacteria bacterium]|tara:strand:- start:244 stop:423 length:180 start_codon:yes stop_codon:yes gene_type:complete
MRFLPFVVKMAFTLAIFLLLFSGFATLTNHPGFAGRLLIWIYFILIFGAVFYVIFMFKK